MASACWSTASYKCMEIIYLCFDINKTKTLIYLNRYPFDALLKDAFNERVNMLNTDTDSFSFHFFVKDITKEINSRPHFRDNFEFSKIGNGQLLNLGRENANVHVREVGYFKDEIKGNSLVDFVDLRPKIYSITLCDACEPIPGFNYQMDMRHNALAKSVARSQIKRFNHEDYVRMYNRGALTNVVNRRIGSKLHQVRLIIYNLIFTTVHVFICFQVYTIEQEKRGLCPLQREAVLAYRLVWYSPESEHPRLRQPWFGGWKEPGGR